MELRHLRCFVAVAEELHFGRAAKKLYMAQPPLSQQIQRLEKSLGVSLFVRSRRHVELTQAGTILLAHAREVLALADQAVQATRLAKAGKAGVVRIGFVGSATYVVMPSLIAGFQESFSEIRLALQEMTTSQQLEALKSRRIDVGFIRSTAIGSEFRARVVLEEEFVLALPSKHPFAGQDQIAIADLSKERFILFPRHLGSGLYEPVADAFRSAGFEPNIAIEAEEMHTVLSLVNIKMGIAVVPACVQSLHWESVVYRRIAPPTPVTQIAAVWMPDRVTEALDTFVNHALRG